jgi:hypothetical protein
MPRSKEFTARYEYEGNHGKTIAGLGNYDVSVSVCSSSQTYNAENAASV